MSLIRPLGGNKKVRKIAQVVGDYVPKEDINRLEEIKEELLELIEEAQRIVSGGDEMTYQRAKSYWIPHVIMALTKEHEWLGGSMETMEDTIEELKEQLQEREEEEEMDNIPLHEPGQEEDK